MRPMRSSVVLCFTLVLALVAGCGASHTGGDASGIDGGPGSDGGGSPIDAGADAGGGFDAGPATSCDSPGATETLPCGLCGTTTRFCTAGRTWAYGACMGESGACEPGTTRTASCGNCGMVTERCGASCAWEAAG